MCSCVTFQVEGVIESLTAVRADVAIDVTVTLDMTTKQALRSKQFLTDMAFETDVDSAKQFTTECYIFFGNKVRNHAYF